MSFVRFGLERRELRQDMDIEMVVSILDWMMERFQDALLTAELDPGLFRRRPDQRPDPQPVPDAERSRLLPRDAAWFGHRPPASCEVTRHLGDTKRSTWQHAASDKNPPTHYTIIGRVLADPCHAAAAAEA